MCALIVVIVLKYALTETSTNEYPKILVRQKAFQMNIQIYLAGKKCGNISKNIYICHKIYLNILDYLNIHYKLQKMTVLQTDLGRTNFTAFVLSSIAKISGLRFFSTPLNLLK